MLFLRAMAKEDLPVVEAWLRLPHVARWWTPDTTADEIAKYRTRISQAKRQTTIMLTVSQDGEPIGWCQWYRWSDYPAEATAMGARAGEAGIDYAIGNPALIGRGIGTRLIGALVAEIRSQHPSVGILTGPDASNTASRRVLEKNGFGLVAVRPVATEPSDAPIAIYRLAATEQAGESTRSLTDS
jgi:aminoglycoside 6'-N-acetyltransferase